MATSGASRLTAPRHDPAATSLSSVAGARMPIPGERRVRCSRSSGSSSRSSGPRATYGLTPSGFVIATVVLTFGYLISRGIAKASRVLEQ